MPLFEVEGTVSRSFYVEADTLRDARGMAQEIGWELFEDIEPDWYVVELPVLPDHIEVSYDGDVWVGGVSGQWISGDEYAPSV